MCVFVCGGASGVCVLLRLVIVCACFGAFLALIGLRVCRMCCVCACMLLRPVGGAGAGLRVVARVGGWVGGWVVVVVGTGD